MSRSSTASSRRGAWPRPGWAIGDLDGVAATAGPGLVGGVMVGLSLRQGGGPGARPAAGGGQPPGGPRGLGAAGGGRRPIPSCCCWSPAATASCWRSRASAHARRLGTTIDDAAGEAFDKIAKALGLRLSRRPGAGAAGARAATPTRFPLPRALLGRKDCDFSFSGLKTAAARLAADAARPTRTGADLAAAVQAAIARQLAERTDRAMAAYAAGHDGRDLRFVVAGGVAANARGARRAGGDGRRRTASPSSPRRWPTAPTTRR